MGTSKLCITAKNFVIVGILNRNTKIALWLVVIYFIPKARIWQFVIAPKIVSCVI